MRLGLRELVFFLVLLGLPCAAYFSVFKEMNRDIDKIRSDNAARQAKLERLEVARHIEDLGQEIAKLNEAVEMFEAKLPAQKEVEVILRQVWQMAAAHNLRPRSVRTGKPIAGRMHSELPIRMEILGNFDGFYSFLLALERLDRITRIREMDLESLPDRNGHVQAKFTLSVFFEPPAGGESGA